MRNPFWLVVASLLTCSACSPSSGSETTDDDIKTGGRWTSPLKDGFYEGDNMVLRLYAGTGTDTTQKFRVWFVGPRAVTPARSGYEPIPLSGECWGEVNVPLVATNKVDARLAGKMPDRDGSECSLDVTLAGEGLTAVSAGQQRSLKPRTGNPWNGKQFNDAEQRMSIWTLGKLAIGTVDAKGVSFAIQGPQGTVEGIGTWTTPRDIEFYFPQALEATAKTSIGTVSIRPFVHNGQPAVWVRWADLNGAIQMPHVYLPAN